MGRLPTLISCLEGLAKELRRHLRLLAAAWLLLPCVSALLLCATLDYFLRFGLWGKVLCCSLTLAVFAAAIWYFLKKFSAVPSLEKTALLVEKARPQADNRIINAVQFAEGGQVSPEFIEAMLEECPLRMELVGVKELYPAKWRSRLAKALPAVLLLWAVPFLLFPAGIFTSLKRILLPFGSAMPYSRTVIADMQPGDIAIKRGQEIEISAVFTGLAPKNASLTLNDEAGTSLELPMVSSENGAFSVKTHQLFATSKYRVSGGDAVSQWYRIDVAQAPALEKWQMDVRPPEYTGLKEHRHSEKDKTAVMPGSSVSLAAVANVPLKEATLLQGDKKLADCKVQGKTISVQAPLETDSPLTISMTSAQDVTETLPLQITFGKDNPPTLALIDTPIEHNVAKGAKIPLAFNVKDDFSVATVGLERLPADFDNGEQVSKAKPDALPCREFQGRFVLDTGSFATKHGEALRFRLWAKDNRPGTKAVYSPVLTVNFTNGGENKDARENARKQAEDGLAAIVTRQRNNLKDTRQSAELIALGKALPPQRLESLAAEQRGIREATVEILKDRDKLAYLAEAISLVANNEMRTVLEVFDKSFRLAGKEQATALNDCAKLENSILAALSGMKDAMATSQDQQNKKDIFDALQKMLKAQQTNFKDTKAAKQDKSIVLKALMFNEERIAKSVTAFCTLCLDNIEQRAADEFGEQLRIAHGIIADNETYELAIDASECLDGERPDLDASLDSQGKVLKIMFQALDVMNKWRVKNAKENINSALETIQEVHEQLEELEKKQAKIAEVTRDISKRGQLTDEDRAKLGEMDKEQKEMADMLEEMANDLYQFPDLPVCNELAAKSREIFEDVLQAMDSENTPIVEIAVQKEDSILDAIRSTKERVEDVEMWLPDIPDVIAWNMESFDTDEMPDMPLVPLPDELEDIIGELTDQAQENDLPTQDGTGNNFIADCEMGWDIMDGNMPSFGAKGKSGNQRPNDNEMTGRSGAGREGQSDGELVENHVKGYEGRETHARRTQDKFQKGNVTEDEDSTFKTKATGGGKLGGESETIGMFGNAPRRDLNTAAHGKSQQQLRKEAEALYASARLFYLNTGGLAEVSRDMRTLENKPPDIREIGSLRKRILRRLNDTQTELSGGTVLPMPISTVRQTGGTATDDSDIEKLSEEYKAMLNDYYKGLDRTN